MKSKRKLAIGLAAAAAVTAGIGGCTLNRMSAVEVNEAVEAYRSRAEQDAEVFSRANWQPPTEAPTTQRSSAAQAVEVPAVSLRQYIVTALQDNPEIMAAAETARSKAARVPQVTALPDPMLTTKTLPEPVRTAEGDNYFILGVQQKLLVPGKLEHAGKVAIQEMRMALETLEATRLRVIADVKRTYFRVYVIDQTIAIDRTNQDLLRGLIDVARSQSEAGRRSQADVLRAQVELSNLEAKIIDLQQRRATAAARMNRLLDRPPQTPLPPVEPFDVRGADSSVEHLFALADSASPELARLRDQIERDRESVKLARLQWWPDFTLGFEWMYMDPRNAFEPLPNPQTGIRPTVSQMSEDGSDNWAITFGFNTPLWVQRIRGGIQEARHRLQASYHEYTARRDMVFFDVEDALARVRAQQELALLFRDTIIPQAQQTYEVSRAAYTTGTTDFLTVIDNWQQWLTFSIQYHRALGELESSIADLEQAIGLSLGRTGPDNGA